MTRKIQKNNEKSNKTVKNMKRRHKTVKKKLAMTKKGKGGKKVKKRTRRTNMKKRVTCKRGGENRSLPERPRRDQYNTAKEFMTAIQKFHKTRAETTFKPNSPEND